MITWKGTLKPWKIFIPEIYSSTLFYIYIEISFTLMGLSYGWSDLAIEISRSLIQVQPISHDQRENPVGEFLAWRHDEGQSAGEFWWWCWWLGWGWLRWWWRWWWWSGLTWWCVQFLDHTLRSPILPFFQVYLLVCLTASQASPLFLDEPTIENLVDDFWDYFFFVMIGLPLDPGTWLVATLLNPRIRLSVCLSVTKRPQTKGVLWHPSLAHYPSYRHRASRL